MNNAIHIYSLPFPPIRCRAAQRLDIIIMFVIALPPALATGIGAALAVLALVR